MTNQEGYDALHEQLAKHSKWDIPDDPMALETWVPLTFTISAKKATDSKWDIEILELTDAEGELIKGRAVYIGEIQAQGQHLIEAKTGLRLGDYVTNLRIDMSHLPGTKQADGEIKCPKHP